MKYMKEKDYLEKTYGTLNPSTIQVILRVLKREYKGIGVSVFVVGMMAMYTYFFLEPSVNSFKKLVDTILILGLLGIVILTVVKLVLDEKRIVKKVKIKQERI